MIWDSEDNSTEEKEEAKTEAGTEEEAASEENCDDIAAGGSEEEDGCDKDDEPDGSESSGEGGETSDEKKEEGSAPEEENSEEESEEDETVEGADEKANAKIAELKDRLLRQMAEFDNYRKRTEKEKKQNFEFGAADFIQKLLPVIDNFERGIDAMSDEDKESSFGKGVLMIYKQFTKLLDDEGVTEIEALGKEFDPNFHNAVMQQPSDEYESGVVMQVLQKGYMYKDRVLRHSMVMVAQ